MLSTTSAHYLPVVRGREERRGIRECAKSLWDCCRPKARQET